MSPQRSGKPITDELRNLKLLPLQDGATQDLSDRADMADGKPITDELRNLKLLPLQDGATQDLSDRADMADEGLRNLRLAAELVQKSAYDLALTVDAEVVMKLMTCAADIESLCDRLSDK